MQKTALTIFGVLLISGSAIGTAASSEHRHNRSSKAYFGRDISEYRGSFNQAGPINVTPKPLDPFDPSAPRNADPVLNPSGS